MQRKCVRKNWNSRLSGPIFRSTDGAMLLYVMDAWRGSERVVRFLASVVRESYQDTLAAVKRADVVVTHPITFGSVLAAQKVGVPWISSVLAPFSFFSAYDPPGTAVAPWMVKLRALGPGAMRWTIAMAKLHSLPWIQPVLDLRKELGLGGGWSSIV